MAEAAECLPKDPLPEAQTNNVTAKRSPMPAV